MLEKTKVYLVGSGIASLASAVYLIKDAKIEPQNIIILEQDAITGGALDGSGNPKDGYVIRGGRMHEKMYRCYWDLLSNIPSYDDPNITVTEESMEFNERFVSHAQARLLKDGKKVDLSSYGIPKLEQVKIMELLFIPEMFLDNKKIEDWFGEEFFETNFWMIFTTMFAFQKWSSVAEMRRYMKRFMHLMPGLKYIGGILRTKYNQYHSVVVPLQRYLEDKGVQFQLEKQVVDIDFDINEDSKRATTIYIKESGEDKTIELGESDYIFVTNGSIVDSTDNGDLHNAPILKGVESSGAWQLWKKIAKKDDSFGNPSVFCDNIDLQKWYSFTVTLNDDTFHDYMEDFSGNTDGTGGLVTMTDSNWLMSIVIARQPHFPNQPKNIKIFWGYGLYPDKIGNHVKKKMSECSGKEILQELFYHLKIESLMEPIINSDKLINCVPTAMPFIDSLFMPRARGDRPLVIPEGSKNFAFLGQFTEIEDDCVFTVEYSTRSAQEAVYGLFDCGKEPIPVYVGAHNPIAMMKATQAITE
ncbi:MAG: oleate hydratase [Epsilonproteobacteria bacterium]|nr:oleate hydratase [Campylobacterota bacterium]